MSMKKQNKFKKTKLSSKMAVDVNLWCRLCLNTCNEANANHIFDSAGSSLTLKIMACSGLEVTQQDSLPKQICLKCRLDLERFFLFRNKCKNSDRKLRHHFRLINAGKESKFYEDFDDDVEDDYTKSIELIKELEKKLHAENQAGIQSGEQCTINDLHCIKKPLQIQPDTTLEHFTRSIRSQQQHNADMLVEKDNNHISFEVLMEDEKDDTNDEVEYILADADYSPNDTDTESFKSDIYRAESSKTCYELSDQTNADSNDLEESKQNIEYLDENYEDLSGNNLLLESLLPAIKASVAQKSGTLLDDKTQYNIIETSSEEMRVQCITSDGKEFEIEMVLDPTHDSQALTYERDESGDFKIFSCSKCTKTFSRRGKLLNHERDHIAKSSGQECPYCQKWFPSNSTLTRHIRVHTGEKPFQCSICKRRFIQKEILKRHLMTHTGEKPFQCPQCSKSFILKEALRQHINRNHTENPTPEMHKCPFCPKSFCHSSGLSRHLLIHAGRTFQCPYCHKKFNDKSALKRHTTSIHNITNNKLSL